MTSGRPGTAYRGPIRTTAIQYPAAMAATRSQTSGWASQPGICTAPSTSTNPYAAKMLSVASTIV